MRLDDFNVSSIKTAIDIKVKAQCLNVAERINVAVLHFRVGDILLP